MAVPKIEERTLYPPIISYLQTIGFEAIGECTVIKKHPDIFFQFGSLSFVVEVKIGKREFGTKAVAQAYDYAQKLKTKNIIILFYREEYRGQTILLPEIVSTIALEKKVKALILTDFWTEAVEIKPVDLFADLKRKIVEKTKKIDFNTTVNLIENYVKDLNSIVYQIRTKEMIAEVVNKMDLFFSIGELKDMEKAKKQVIILASYLLFNQLLFYHIFQKKSPNTKLRELTAIKKVKDIQVYFDKITNIDYQSIYRINILGHIPEKEVVINTLNDIIKAIKLLRAEHITQDLAGRFFHDLIPCEIRKVLAAFYTHPNAARILAELTINSWDASIIDPACGSGTLLVSAYEKKWNIYKTLHGYKNKGEIHKKFIEEDITGLDIMPFAAHITTINLTMQNIDQKTNIVRIGTSDSLDLVYALKTMSFRKKGIKISPYTEIIQKSLFGISDQKIKKGGAISPAGKGTQFYLRPVDEVIMNHPFSDREKMPVEMRKKLNRSPLGEICGHKINLWGYFLVLSDLLLKKNGKIGAVIPINIARGKATEKIRNFLLNNYHIEFIVKPVGDTAFSEGCSFKDLLFIARKRKPLKKDFTKIVFLRKSIKHLSPEEIKHIVEAIYRRKEYFDEYLEITSISQTQIIRNRDNLMLFLAGKSIKNVLIIREFYDKFIRRAKDFIKTFEKEYLSEGFGPRPKGLSKLVFLNRKLGEKRIKNAFMIIESLKKNEISIYLKNTGEKYKLKVKDVCHALRTITNVNIMDISKITDYLTINKFRDFEKIRMYVAKFKGSVDWRKIKISAKNNLTHLAIPTRYRMNSENTHLTCFYSEIRFVPTNAFFIYKGIEGKESNKILAIFLNSILYLIQFFLRTKETTQGFFEIKQFDLKLMYILNIEKLCKKDMKILIQLFNKLKNVKYPSILEQLESRFWARVELDKTILKIFKFSRTEINELLPKVYDAIVRELKK